MPFTDEEILRVKALLRAVLTLTMLFPEAILMPSKLSDVCKICFGVLVYDVTSSTSDLCSGYLNLFASFLIFLISYKLLSLKLLIVTTVYTTYLMQSNSPCRVCTGTQQIPEHCATDAVSA